MHATLKHIPWCQVNIFLLLTILLEYLKS